MLLAVGLDPNRSIIFHQSNVPAHSELMWILSCQASTGYLSRMTQWKDKTSNERGNKEKLKLGLFSYPVLQAADVLVHRIGHDQAQHLEFAREVAVGFNHTYGTGVLVPPETLISPAKRIMSLATPTMKMSKSDQNPKSRIMLTDSEEVIKSKIKAAVTDSDTSSISYDPEGRPGVSNLLDILYYSHTSNEYRNQETLAQDLNGVSFKALKEKAAQAVEVTIRPIREQYYKIRSDEQLMDRVAAEGAVKARASAETTLDGVKHAVGLA
ncbi:Tryptophan--tRNA ligase, mitochondrial [Vermiconidia calcicola]|uniref:Tryptophan--tRNA ligase, mitochondrial n=1 Tax=Vermiconidia calcicola TaxID=1690605 RepID=A0ACC3NHA7_9PEZI|nr:Tryptophan--tRNA ligase, mitochondrial [Vermiconidia calcicola]